MYQGIKITPEKFAQVKYMQELNFKPKLIHQAIGLGTASINRIRRSATYEDYKKLVAEMYAKQSLKLKALPLAEQLQPDTDRTPQQQTYKQDELLQVLANLTDAIVSMTVAWVKMEDKLNEVLETKRPWLAGRR